VSGRVLIVVPCYNESARLPAAVFAKFLAASACGFVFVDDGSKDDTIGVLNHLRAGYEDRVTVLQCRTNRGKAEAVRFGINHALKSGVAYVGFWDADLATPLEEISEFCAILDQSHDIEMVFGSRVKLLGRNIERVPARHYAGRVFATVVSAVLRMPIYDTQCGAKLFRAGDSIRQIFAEPFLSRWVFDVELIARYIRQVGSTTCAAKGIYEFPLHAWADVKGSRLKLSDFGVAIWDVYRIYWKYMRGIDPGRR
jgi:dolichyl-phosphate beta-glucosyltransferase